MPENSNKNHSNINIKDLVIFALSKWPIFVCMTVLFTAVAFIYSSFIAVPLYVSTGKIHIMNQTTDKLTSSDHQPLLQRTAKTLYPTMPF